MIRFVRIALALVLLAPLGQGATDASEPTATKSTTKRLAEVRHKRRRPVSHTVRRPAYAPAQAGLVIAWDPESHTFTMPAPDRSLPLTAAEKNALSRSFAGLVQVRHPDGSVSVDLQGRFQEFAVVHLGADGKRVYGCLDDTAAVRRTLLEPLPASGLEER